MNKESIRMGIGIVGCGRAAGSLHLPALQKIDGVKVLAIADTDERALNRIGEQFNIERRFTDPEAIFDDPSINTVAVCVPAQRHVEIALPVLEAGKHLLVEKPLALDLDGCDRLAQAATRTNATAMVGFNLRFHRLVLDAKRLVDTGKLGEIEAISSKWTSAIRYRQSLPEWRDQRALGGGALFEIGVHHFDLWRYLLGSGIAEVFTTSRSTDWQDETVTVSARMESGVLATGLFSERTSDSNELEICGQKGRLKISLFQYDGLEFVPSSMQPGTSARIMKIVRTALSIPKGIAIMHKGGDFLLSYQNEWRHFVNVIANGEAAGSSLEDGRAAVQAVLAAHESAATGQPVSISNS